MKVKKIPMRTCVVTKEKYKAGSAQLPNVCEALGVRWISYDDFMEKLSVGM